jgi:hypothetical protein
MIERFAYARPSRFNDSPGRDRSLEFAPNLAREPVAFDAELRNPIRFREAICALHAVVVNDLRFKKRDKSSYEAWKKQQGARDAVVRREAYAAATRAIEERRKSPEAKALQADFDGARKRYWSARQAYSDHLRVSDPQLWRQLMPCDPVITVAEDAVLFECFSSDEASYGCLSVSREDAFGPSVFLQMGTTNVDYSQSLYDQFQTLRTYRKTRFALDPLAFEVRSSEAPVYREEKIDLPESWLRGFGKLQAAMTMPAVTRVPLSREAVYALLAFLRRRRAWASPRALRFELDPGRPARLVLEPWERTVATQGIAYSGPALPAIRIWGTRRLLTLARLLPLIDRVDVVLLGTGLPSFWVVRMGEMSFTLGLSGWTTNDWSAGSALDLLAPPTAFDRVDVGKTVGSIKTRRAATLDEVCFDTGAPRPHAEAVLRHLAQTGQLIYDLSVDRYRYRQILSQPLGESQLGPESEEVSAARLLVARRRYELIDRQPGPKQSRLLTGKVESTPVEILIDADDRILRGKCLCGHYRQFGLRNGPCRHMLALRWGTSAVALEMMERGEAFSRAIGRS